MNVAQPRPAETSGHAITALVFAVLGWLVLPVLGAVVALIFAARARRELRADPWLRGAGFVSAARAIAIVQLVLLLLAVAVGGAIGLAAGWNLSHDSGPARLQPGVSTGANTPPPEASSTFVSSGRLVGLVRALPPPSQPLGGVFHVRSIGDYRWADSGPANTAGTLRFNLAPRPPFDATLIRLMVFRSSRMGLRDLRTAAGNFGSDLLEAAGQPGSCWSQDGEAVCEVLVGRVLVEVRSPANSYGSLEMANTTVEWLREQIPLEATLTARP